MIVTADSPVPREVVDGIVADRRLPRRPDRQPLDAGQPCSACAQVLHEVLAASTPHERRTRSGGHRGGRVLHGLVGHRLRHLDQRLHAAERLRQREDLAWPPRSGRPPGGGTRPSRRSPASARPRRRGARAGTRSPRARSRCGRPRAGAACAGRGGRGSSRTGRAPRRSRSARSGRARAAPRRAPRPRRRPRRSGRRGTSWPSGPRRRRRARAGAARSGVANVLSTATSASPLALDHRRRCPPRSAAGWWASRPRSAASRAAARARARRGRSGRPCRTRARSA